MSASAAALSTTSMGTHDSMHAFPAVNCGIHGALMFFPKRRSTGWRSARSLATGTILTRCILHRRCGARGSGLLSRHCSFLLWDAGTSSICCLMKDAGVLTVSCPVPRSPSRPLPSAHIWTPSRRRATPYSSCVCTMAAALYGVNCPPYVDDSVRRSSAATLT